MRTKSTTPTGPDRILLIGLALLAVGLACARQPVNPTETKPPEPALVEGSRRHDGLERHYLLRLPAGYQNDKSYPLVLALHGGGGSGDRMCSLEAGIQTLADEEGFLVLCPDGVEDHWNDGRPIDNYESHKEGVDDIGFLLNLIEWTIERYAVDTQRVFVTGFSNGGMMAYRLACEHADQIAAIAPSIANMPEGLDCQPSEPIPVMILNGTQDPLMPFDGGQVGTRRNPLGPVLSTEATAAFWALHNGCDARPSEEVLPQRDSEDPTSIRKLAYQGCQSEAQVLLYIVEGGGHTWPGGPQYAPEFVIGPSSNQADTAALIWQFFNSNSPAGS